MQRKAIPLLIALMIIALSGIIAIQYTWIKKSVTEKQALIDQKVLQAVSSVDEQLSNAGTIAFFNSFTTNDSMSLIISDSLITDTLGSTWSLHTLAEPIPTRDMRVQVVTSHHQLDSINAETHHVLHKTDSMMIGLQHIENELMMIDEVRGVFDQLRFESFMTGGDIRLDSSRIDKHLKSALASLELDTLVQWSLFDKTNGKYLMDISAETEFRYKMPLFKEDIIHPGKYEIHLNLLSNTNHLWQDIRSMIILSVLFVLIILSVFIFAVKLILKHKKISQIKSDFINNMTHEFKTPLASISLAADSIVHPNIITDQKRIADYIEIIHQEKSKLNQHVERILEVASLEKDAIEIPIEKVDLCDVIKDCCDDLKLLIQQHDVSLSMILPDVLNIKGNRFHLTQALVNIIENGIKYSTDKPNLKIELVQFEKTAELKITDRGIGMTPDQIKRVFDSFYRVQTGNLHNTKGFGLGLTYAKFVVEKLNGTIGIESKPQEGTTVTIKLPLYG